MLWNNNLTRHNGVLVAHLPNLGGHLMILQTPDYITSLDGAVDIVPKPAPWHPMQHSIMDPAPLVSLQKEKTNSLEYSM